MSITLVTKMMSTEKHRELLREEMEKEKDEWKQVGNLKREALNKKKKMDLKDPCLEERH